MTAANYPHAEHALAAELGLAQKDLRDVRGDLERGADWQHVGKEVRYSATGRARLLEALKITPAAAPEDSAPKNSAGPGPVPSTPPATPVPPELAAARAQLLGVLHLAAAQAAPADVAELIVVRVYPLNRRIVLAARDGARVRVRVPNSKNLVPGMAMKCRHRDGDLWELAQRLPRWRGKW